MRFPFTIAFSASSLRYHCEFPDVPEMSQYEFDTKEEVGALGRDKLLYTLEYAYRRQGRVIPTLCGWRRLLFLCSLALSGKNFALEPSSRDGWQRFAART